MITITFEEAVNLTGSQAELARALGVTRKAVWNWKKTGVPKGRVYQLQYLFPEWFMYR